MQTSRVFHELLRIVLGPFIRMDRLFFRKRSLFKLVLILSGLSSVLFLNPALKAETNSIVARLAEKSLLLDIAHAGNRLVVVGERGHVLVSDDEAETWRQVIVPTQAMLTSVFFANEKDGWAVGHDANILRTQNGGDSWTLVYSAPEEENPLLDVWFRDSKYGIAVGAYAFMLVTEDGGETWEQAAVNEDDDFHLNHIFSADNVLYITAEAGFVYRSGDFGTTWEALELPYEGSFFGGLKVNGKLYAFGLRGHMYVSADDGESWDEISVATQSMLTSAISGASNGMLVSGLGGVLLHSRDGIRFSVKQFADRAGISAVALTKSEKLVMVGEQGIKKIRLAEVPGN